MKATKRIRKLLKDLQALAESSVAEAGEEEADQDALLPAEDTSPSDVTRSEPGASKSTPLKSSRCSDTDTSSPSESDASKVLHNEVERLVQELGDSRVLVATLQAEIKMLGQEKEEQHERDDLSIQRLEAELRRLEQQAQVELATLKKRQQQIELDVPDVEQQLKGLKEVLHDLNVSEPLYADLLAVPEEKRDVKAHLQILAYDRMKKFREETETLRKERDTSRESLARQNEEVERMQRELQRSSVAAAMEKREIEKEMSALMARNERLEAELNEALVKVEVLSAKGAMYDEVKEKLDKAEQNAVNADNQKAVMTATLQVVTEEKHRLLEVIKDKDHCLDLLSMDKIYLSREVKTHLDQVKKLEQEQEHQHEKLRALKTTRQELYNRVLSDNRDTQAAHEQRLQVELARLQEQAHRDIEHIRKEATEVADEKVKTYREMRDAAQLEAERLQAIQREHKSTYDELLTKYQELQRVSEAKEIEARSGIRVRDFELEQLRVSQQEIKCMLNQKSIQNEALTEKVKVLTEKYHTCEMELERPAALLQTELEIIRRKLEQYENQALGRHNTPDKEMTHEATSSGRNKQTAASRSDNKKGRDGLVVLKRSMSVQTSERGKPHGRDFKGQAQKVVQERDERWKPVPAQLQTEKTNIENANEEVSLGENTDTNIMLHTDVKKVRAGSEHMCQRLHNLQLDLRKILESRGTLESFQNLLREKGIHISDNVLRKITRAKEVERISSHPWG